MPDFSRSPAIAGARRLLAVAIVLSASLFAACADSERPRPALPRGTPPAAAGTAADDAPRAEAPEIPSGPDRAFAARLDRLEATPGGALADALAGAEDPRRAVTARNWLSRRIVRGESLGWYAVFQARGFWQMANQGPARQRAEFRDLAALWAQQARLAMIVDGGWCALREGPLARIEDGTFQLEDIERHFAGLPLEQRQHLARRALEIEAAAQHRAPDRWLCRDIAHGVAPEIPDPRDPAPRVETERTWREARKIARARFARAHGLSEP